MQREPTYGLTSVRRIVLVVGLAQPLHDLNRSQHGPLSLMPLCVRAQFQQGQQYESRTLVGTLRVEPQQAQDCSRLSDLRLARFAGNLYGGLLAHLAPSLIIDLTIHLTLWRTNSSIFSCSSQTPGSQERPIAESCSTLG